MDESVEVREAAFWDEYVPSLAACIAQYEAGPDELTGALLDALEPLGGARVLDFACGVGLLSAWLVARGALVTGLDISSGSVTRARELAEAVHLPASFVVGELTPDVPAPGFDRVCGRFALHHTDVQSLAPVLASKLEAGGSAAFLETMGTNPLLRFGRRLTGHFGIPRYGTEDEHPLVGRDLAALRSAFGELHIEVPRMTFLRLFDRQVLHFRSPRASKALGALDDALAGVGLGRLSYQQLLVLRKPE